MTAAQQIIESVTRLRVLVFVLLEICSVVSQVIFCTNSWTGFCTCSLEYLACVLLSFLLFDGLRNRYK